MSGRISFVALVVIAIACSRADASQLRALRAAKALSLNHIAGNWEGTCYQMAYSDDGGNKAMCTQDGAVISYTFSVKYNTTDKTYTYTGGAANMTVKKVHYFYAPWAAPPRPIKSVVGKAAASACVTTSNVAFHVGLSNKGLYSQDGTCNLATNGCDPTCPTKTGKKNLYCKAGKFNYYCEAKSAPTTCITAKDGLTKNCSWTLGKDSGKACTFKLDKKTGAFIQTSCVM